jgi:UDP-N-acetylmuramate--alanine ligase
VDAADIAVTNQQWLEQRPDDSEIARARETGKLIKWQQFLSDYIFPTRRLVAVAGTHGKTTTASLVAHILEAAGLDPTAFVGAIVPNWNSSARYGKGEFAVIEADEYADNFAPYRPEVVVLNNLEMEHPEYFTDWEHYKWTFIGFLKNAKTVIYNADDSGVREILDFIICEKIPFSAKDFPGWETPLLGAHNRANAMAAITLARYIGIDDDVSKKALKTFRAAGHRLQKIHDDGALVVFDDYAHHHTQIRNTLAALREAYPEYKLVAIFEPHLISRYAQNTKATLDALGLADKAIIVEFYHTRETHLAKPDVNADIEKFGAANVRYIPDFDAAISAAKGGISGKTVVVVMGAGKSFAIGPKII